MSVKTLHFRTIFTEGYRELIESVITWCKNNHLKPDISKTNVLVVDYSALNVDVSAQNFTHLFQQHRRSLQSAQV